MKAITEIPEQQFNIFKFIPLKLAPWLLAIIACVIYMNTLPNQFALDDDLVFKNNKYVQQGFSGIPTILTSDIFASYFEDYDVDQMLSGGRYRPLSQVTFAIEYQLFGAKPMTGHIINMLLYGLLIAILFKTLLRSFRMGPDVVFITTLLFAVHPVHTEVVANIKSRDEILSLMFILLSFRYYFSYTDTAKMKYLLFAGLMTFLALLSKEYAYVLLILLPVAISTFRQGKNEGKLLPVMLTFLSAAIVFSMMRYSIVGFQVIQLEEVLNNPYYNASPTEALATKVFVLLKYLLLLIFPHTLSADYSYPQIPYADFASPVFWISAIIYIGITAAGIYYTYKRHFMGFAILTYLLFLFPVSNLVLDIGATMGERLLFHASFGFCLAVSYLLVQLHHKFSLNSAMLTVPLLLILIAASAKTMQRNRAWYDTDTLFLTDVKTNTEGIIVNANAGDAMLKRSFAEKDPVKKKAQLNEARAYLKKTLIAYPEFVNGLVNMGLVEHQEGRNDTAMKYWLQAQKYLPQSPHFPRLATFFYEQGMIASSTDLRQGITYLKMATQLAPAKSEYMSNLGGAYYTIKNYDSAMYCWEAALRINPNDPEALKGKAALTYTTPQPAK
jgi:cytochrome c-type biogenesis protein CcmH/NrfG